MFPTRRCNKRSLPAICLKDSSLQHWRRWKLWTLRQPRPQPTTQKWRGGRPRRGGLADRAALEAQWAEERATIAAAADQRIQSMYGGFQIPAGLGGN